MENNRPNINNSNRNRLNLREMLLKYLAKWYWFVISTIVCLGLAILYLSIVNDKYKIETSILLRKSTPGSELLDMSTFELGMPVTSKEVEDEIQVLTSQTIMRNVILDLNIGTEYFQRKGLKYVELYPLIPLRIVVPAQFSDTAKYRAIFKIDRSDKGYSVRFKYDNISAEYQLSSLSEAVQTPVGEFKFKQILPLKGENTYKIVSYPIHNLTEDYCKDIKVNAVTKKSNAINISTTAACIKKTKDILNKLIELYNQDAVIDKNRLASNTASFIDERLKLISLELQGVEKNVESFKKINNVTDIKSEAKIYLKSAQEYDAKLAELEAQLNLVSYIESYVKDNKYQYDLVPANLGITDKSLLEVMQQYNTALLERTKLMRTGNDKNPVITQLEQHLKELRWGIITSIASIKDGLKIIKRNDTGKGSEFASKIKAVPTQEREYLEIKRQQEIKQKLYLFLLEKREENALNLASTIPTAKTLDSAYTSILPVEPRKIIIILLALVLGIGFPIVIFYVMDVLNDKIVDKAEIQKLLKVPYLGSIALSKNLDRIVVREGNATPIAEMFRLIRSNLQFMLGDTKSPVILVTSTIAGEGKSFTSINIAMSFALMQKKVVLVGLDVRNPMLSEYLHIAKDKGISLFLSDSTYKVQDIIVDSGFHSFLSVIHAGPIPPNPSELLMSSRLDDLILTLKEDFDYIILDSAPVGVVSDTYLLNRLVDNCIYVARQDFTPRGACTLINEICADGRINKVSVVLNGTDESIGFGAGYGYGYGSGKKKK